MLLISWIAVVLIMILLCCLLEYWITPVIPRMSGSRRRRWPTNFAFYFINTGLHFAIPISTVTAAKYAESEGLGILNVIELPNWIDCLMTACFISFAAYLFHLAMHKIPFFWSVHRVHHSDDDLDWSSALRNHPFEVLLGTVYASSIGLVLGLNSSIVIIMFLLNLVIDFLSHSRITLSKKSEAILQYIIITPQLHHIHHSNWHKETDSNFGGDFSIWDRIFGTLNRVPLRPPNDFSYGIDTIESAVAHDLDWLLKSPIKSDIVRRGDPQVNKIYNK